MLTSVVLNGVLGIQGPALSAKLPPNDFGYAPIPDLVVVEFDGKFNLYANTDGEGKHLSTSGLLVVWKSKDFLTWSFEVSILPQALEESTGPQQCDSPGRESRLRPRLLL